jgi:hypothetical protein
MLKHKVASVLFFLVAFPFLSSYSCCFDTISVQQCIQNPKMAIFSGRVIDFGEANVYDCKGKKILFYTIEVISGWKDISNTAKIVSFYLDLSSTDYRFKKDSIYLIYAREKEKGEVPVYVTSICERTRLLSEATYDLQELSKQLTSYPVMGDLTSGNKKNNVPHFNYRRMIVPLLLLSIILNVFFMLRRNKS